MEIAATFKEIGSPHWTISGGAEAVAALKKQSNARRAALQVARDLERLRADKGLFAYEPGVVHAALGELTSNLAVIRDAVAHWAGGATRAKQSHGG